MFKSVSFWASMALLAIVFPAMITAQESQKASSPTPALNAPFDELNSRLRDAADQLLAAPVSNSATQAAAVYATTERSTPRQETAQMPEQRGRAGARVQQLRPVIDPILRGEGIPSEMVAVALVESGGQPSALSPKGARGVWQLMPDTARRYGLVVSDAKDERLDLVSATRAAARYLRDLHSQFGDWELAVAAYNAGEQAVQNAIQRAGSNSFAVLSQLRLLPAETRSYVPAVMGARGLFAHTPAVAGESASVSTPQTSGRPAQNFAGGKVFYAMNASDEAQQSTSSIKE